MGLKTLQMKIFRPKGEETGGPFKILITKKSLTY